MSLPASVCVCVSVWGHQFVHIWGWKSNSLFPSWQHRWLFSQLCMPRWFTFDLFLKWIPASHWAQTVIRSRLPACAWGDKPRPCVQPSTIVLRDPLRSRKVVWVCPRFVFALNEQTVYNLVVICPWNREPNAPSVKLYQFSALLVLWLMLHRRALLQLLSLSLLSPLN